MTHACQKWPPRVALHGCLHLHEQLSLILPFYRRSLSARTRVHLHLCEIPAICSESAAAWPLLSFCPCSFSCSFPFAYASSPSLLYLAPSDTSSIGGPTTYRGGQIMDDVGYGLVLFLAPQYQFSNNGNALEPQDGW